MKLDGITIFGLTFITIILIAVGVITLHTG